MKRLRFGNLLRERVEREVSGRYLSSAERREEISEVEEGGAELTDLL